MRFTDRFIERPVLAIVVSALVLLLGLASLSRVGIREFPALERSVITVTTVFPGASARTVQGFVTTPLQVNIAGAAGIDYLSATSDAGVSTIEVHVRLGEDTDQVLTEVVAKVAQARDELPRDTEDPVIATGSGDDALMYLAFTSEQLSPFQINDYLLRSVQPELATLDGVGKAAIFGRPLAMRLWLDPVRMAALGVTAADVSEAVRRDNFLSTAGATEGKLVRINVDARTDMQTVEDFERLVVRQEGERQVRLSDIAEVELAAENNQSRAFSSGEAAVFMALEAAPDANPLEVSAAVHAQLPKLRASLPADLKLRLDWDGSIAIDAALREVATTLIEATLIVIAVIYLFLGSFRVVLVPLVIIPLSLIGVVALILAMGFSLNLLTLLAMVIAIGLVVDDAIVVVENVHRHVEEGATPLQAAITGAREVAMPVLAMTLTLAAVYAPIAFIGGLTGALFSEFALTLAGAVLVSGLIALTLSPVMASRVLKHHGEQGRFADWLDARFSALTGHYQRLLDTCLGNRGAVLLFAGAILCALPLLFLLTRDELAPEEDTGGVFYVGVAPSYANLDYINRYLDQVVDLWQDIPEVASSWQVIEPSSNFGGLTLTHWDERERTQQAVQAQFQQRLGGIAGMELFSFGTPSLPGAGGGLPLAFVVASTAPQEEVYRVGEELLQRARESGLFIFVNQTLDFNRPEVEVRIDRERAARLGIAMRDIGETLAVMLGEAEVNRFTYADRSYKVIPQAGRDFRLTEEELEKYYLRAAGNGLVPLSTVIRLEHRIQPNQLSQYQQLNSTTIQGLMLPPNTLGTGLAFLEKTLAEIAPPSFRAGHTGESRRYKQESGSFPLLFGLSLILIFLVLAAQFNSFRDPLVVLVAVPLSIFGAVVPIALGMVTLNIYTQIGLLTLIGLISKHGILIVEFANQLTLRGAPRRDAVLEAAALRLRPILMTTFATVLGVLPLLLASGAGANARFGIGLMIAAGMLVGTLFTLFVLPVFYLPLRRRAATPPADAEEQMPAVS
ncbi:efflux RND transporter permease subunit [Pseudohaliea rubra]|uniref:RND multidrug efflux transporter, Acriflavin resistance protein n=1 Tax=Pseudohaliea rubra DSM 19751 TaxID=1265313 RepID=A0A095VU52_9GAMM|nr:efflux RND transporter permease subunit [Pseudohaliea rubra]KGE04900.1 RND multidrug efflux transporter, Acriflavin resistance protein [Pseudohaliea rubra DSM 19751]